VNKFELVREVLRQVGAETAPASLLDVGCRGCELQSFLGAEFSYSGVDLVQNAAGTVEHVADLAQGLPLPDGSKDVVVALDVVEHVDDMEGALDEMLRVARKHVIVMLPNMAFVSHRLRFMFTGRIGDKYDLAYGRGTDRHRWLTTQAQGDAFIAEFARQRGVACETRWYTGSRRKDVFAALCRMLGLSPNLWAWASLHVLTRR
jgi:SAM-dependent methyltransferase